MVIKITPKQSKRINALIRKLCCNYVDGSCLLLDDGEEIVPRYTHNLCSATTLAGKVETFTCGLDEKCCYGAMFNEKFCVPLSKSCF